MGQAQPTAKPSPLALRVVLAQPRGFCAGVVRAIDIVEQALALHGAPVYVLHEIVHNAHVVAQLRERGARFVEQLDEVPPGALLIFSAHGVAPATVRAAAARGLRTLDATCPLVAKVHLHALRYRAEGRALVIIGHRDHAEVRGTLGAIAEAGATPADVAVIAGAAEVTRLPWPAERPTAYVTQTTLSLDDTREVIQALQARHADLSGPGTDDICYATQNRQNAVRALAREVQLVLVVGAAHSSNAQRLREVAAQAGVRAHLVQHADELQDDWLAGVTRVGLSSGASTPEVLVQGVLARLEALGVEAVLPLEGGIVERVSFRLPDLRA